MLFKNGKSILFYKMRYLIDNQYYSKDELLMFCLKIKQGNQADWQKAIYAFIEDYLSDSLYITVQTSGTTGTPKQMNLFKSKMKISANKTAVYFKFEAGQKVLLALPATYIAAKMMIVRALEHGLNLICVEPKISFLANLNDNIYFCPLVPMQAHKAITNKASLKKIQNIKHVLLGGATVGKQLLNVIQKQPNKYYHSYGMTETISHIALRTLNQPYSKYFTVLPGVSITKDSRNCLVVNAPKLCAKPIITNDIVEIKEERSFKWLGRFDTIINSGGIKIIPELVEAKIEHLIKQAFFIAGEHDEKLGEKVVLYIETNVPINKKELLFQLEKELPKYHAPKKIELIAAFKRTASGKIIKRNIANVL